jgi:hypothetical protein
VQLTRGGIPWTVYNLDTHHGRRRLIDACPSLIHYDSPSVVHDLPSRVQRDWGEKLDPVWGILGEGGEALLDDGDGFLPVSFGYFRQTVGILYCLSGSNMSTLGAIYLLGRPQDTQCISPLASYWPSREKRECDRLPVFPC